MRKDCLPFALLGAEPFTGFNGLWGHLLEMWETAGRMSGSGGRTKAIPRHRASGHQGTRLARTVPCKPWNVSDLGEQTALQCQPGFILKLKVM